MRKPVTGQRGWPGYRHPSGEMIYMRGIIDVDGKQGKFYGAGTTPEKACAAFWSFLSSKCTCLPREDSACLVHPEVEEFVDASDSAVGVLCRFVSFPSNFKRWPSSGIDKNGDCDTDIIEGNGFYGHGRD